MKQPTTSVEALQIFMREARDLLNQAEVVCDRRLGKELAERGARMNQAISVFVELLRTDDGTEPHLEKSLEIVHEHQAKGGEMLAQLAERVDAARGTALETAYRHIEWATAAFAHMRMQLERLHFILSAPPYEALRKTLEVQPRWALLGIVNVQMETRGEPAEATIDQRWGETGDWNPRQRAGLYRLALQGVARESAEQDALCESSGDAPPDAVLEHALSPLTGRTRGSA